MAEGERRMLFDIRGRRKHVIRVVYAILAVLMGASLFLVVGPVSIGELVGNQTTTSEGVEIFDEQAERIEQRLRANPANEEELLIALTRARINAGRSASEGNVDPNTGEAILSGKSRNEYERANDSWNRYLEVVGKEPNPSVAGLIASTAFLLAQNSRSYPEAFEYLEQAADAQRHIAQGRPSLGAYTTLAAYEYLGGDFAAGAQAGAQAAKLARTKAERKAIASQLTTYRKQGEKIQKSKKAAEKAEKGKGKEALENPLGGLGGSEPPTVAP